MYLPACTQEEIDDGDCDCTEEDIKEDYRECDFAETTEDEVVQEEVSGDGMEITKTWTDLDNCTEYIGVVVPIGGFGPDRKRAGTPAIQRFFTHPNINIFDTVEVIFVSM